MEEQLMVWDLHLKLRLVLLFPLLFLFMHCESNWFVLQELGLWKGREMVEMTMDYQEPGANTNPRGGLSPPPSTP